MENIVRPVLDAAREQLKYWQDERAAAGACNNARRIEQCEHFLKQSELVVSALEEAAARARK